MGTIATDTLSIANRLKAKGFQQEQAEAVAHEIKEVVSDESLASKSDLRELELGLTIKTSTMIIALGAFLTAIKYWG